MSDPSDVRTDTPPPGLPPHVRKLLAPWWSARADRLATLLEAAVNAGETMIALDGKNITVEHLTDTAQYAIEMVEKLAAAEKSQVRPCT